MIDQIMVAAGPILLLWLAIAFAIEHARWRRAKRRWRAWLAQQERAQQIYLATAYRGGRDAG